MKRAERGVSKKCPDCDQQCPVALRACNCGYSFTKTRPNRAVAQQAKQKSANAAAAAAAASTSTAKTTSKASTSSSSSSSKTTTESPDTNLDKEGRRFRTKRMRPDFFNSLELEYASRTFRQRKPKPDDKDKKKKRGRPKGSTGGPRKPKEDKKKEEEEAKVLPELDDMYANFSQERLQQFSFILDELNFKMTNTMFKPL